MTSAKCQWASDNEQVLIVTGPTCRELLQAVFCAAGYQVRAAQHGGEGMSQLSQQSYDLIISDLDIHSPRRDWRNWLDKSGAGHDIPVIFLSSRRPDRMRQPALLRPDLSQLKTAPLRLILHGVLDLKKVLLLADHLLRNQPLSAIDLEVPPPHLAKIYHQLTSKTFNFLHYLR